MMTDESLSSRDRLPDLVPTGRSTRFPPAPSSPKEAGVESNLLIQLLVKTVYLAGELTEASAAQHLKLPYAMVAELFRVLRAEKVCDVQGLTGAGGILHRYRLTELGMGRARDYMDVSQYVGAAPVSLAQYDAVVQRQSVLNLRIDRPTLEKAMGHLVLTPDIMERLGGAVNSAWPIFIWGESGNGKTVIAEAIGNLLGMLGGAEILFPYAMEVDNQILQMYDPGIHTAVEVLSGSATSTYDARWVLCRRPTVFTGGELTLQMLDLSFNPISKYYDAPPQLKASGGVFIIDDFGRQKVHPEDLLNRWIVPLEYRIDYLTLHTGKKFRIPFDSVVVFATNLEPRKLADEAFLRRMRNKIYIGDPAIETYTEIFRRYCEKRDIRFDLGAIEYLHREYYLKYGVGLRSCHPRDLIEQILSAARFQGIAPSLDKQLLDRACEIYFGLEMQEGRKS